jgi:hypothetical protein
LYGRSKSSNNVSDVESVNVRQWLETLRKRVEDWYRIKDDPDIYYTETI